MDQQWHHGWINNGIMVGSTGLGWEQWELYDWSPRTRLTTHMVTSLLYHSSGLDCPQHKIRKKLGFPCEKPHFWSLLPSSNLWHSYGKYTSIVSFPMKNSDFPYVSHYQRVSPIFTQPLPLPLPILAALIRTSQKLGAFQGGHGIPCHHRHSVAALLLQSRRCWASHHTKRMENMPARDPKQCGGWKPQIVYGN